MLAASNCLFDVSLHNENRNVSKEFEFGAFGDVSFFGNRVSIASPNYHHVNNNNNSNATITIMDDILGRIQLFDFFLVTDNGGRGQYILQQPQTATSNGSTTASGTVVGSDTNKNNNNNGAGIILGPHALSGDGNTMAIYLSNNKIQVFETTINGNWIPKGSSLNPRALFSTQTSVKDNIFSIRTSATPVRTRKNVKQLHRQSSLSMDGNTLAFFVRHVNATTTTFTMARIFQYNTNREWNLVFETQPSNQYGALSLSGDATTLLLQPTNDDNVLPALYHYLDNDKWKALPPPEPTLLCWQGNCTGAQYSLFRGRRRQNQNEIWLVASQPKARNKKGVVRVLQFTINNNNNNRCINNTARTTLSGNWISVGNDFIIGDDNATGFGAHSQVVFRPDGTSTQLFVGSRQHDYLYNLQQQGDNDDLSWILQRRQKVISLFGTQERSGSGTTFLYSTSSLGSAFVRRLNATECIGSTNLIVLTTDGGDNIKTIEESNSDMDEQRSSAARTHDGGFLLPLIFIILTWWYLLRK